MYLSLESFSNIDYFLNAEGSSNFSNVLFAVKCGKGNLQMKIESSLKQTYGGVYFFSKPMNPNEIDELDQNEWNEFLDAFSNVDKVVVTDVYAASEDVIEGVNSERFAKDLANHIDIPCEYIKGSIADVAKKLYPELRKNDVVIGLGAGTITNLSKELLNVEKEAVGAGN